LKKEILKSLPSVDQLAGTQILQQATETFDREIVIQAIRSTLKDIRAEILKTGEKPDLSHDVLGQQVCQRLEKRYSSSLEGAINATGIILHTGLGRARLGKETIQAVNRVTGYCTLAIDRDTGRRGHRDKHLEGLICDLTGAEAATTVCNNAAATMVTLNTLAKGKEVIVSRGQLVEIGGSFRIPEVMETSGAILRDIGTTNKTHLKDYKNAINENTGAILNVHHSNYRIMGFAQEPSVQELIELGKKHRLPVFHDIGSGALVDLRDFGLEEPEPMVQESIKAGIDVACFSGDKLIGGPQAGIIVGKKRIVDRIRKNPLGRACRVGKLTLAALEATLKLFLNRKRLAQDHPIYRMLSADLSTLKRRAGQLVRGLAKEVGTGASINSIKGESQMGSGSVPAKTIPTWLLKVEPKKISPDGFAGRLRNHTPPVFPRIHKDNVLLDLRTIQPDEDKLVKEAIVKALKIK
jgi:L-seryl-tRNA(Ser) seleniumtransferase